MIGRPVNDRVLAVRMLAGALFDLFPSPAGPKFYRAAVRGEAPSEKIPCPDCGDTESPGWRSDRFKRLSPCLTCGGRSDDVTGRMRGGQGVVRVDGYTRRIVGSETTVAPARVEAWLCNVCHGKGVEPKKPSERCRACGGEGQREHRPFVLAVSDPAASDPETVLEAAIERRDRAGSFHELEEALAYLRRKSPHLHRVFWQVAVVKTVSERELPGRDVLWLRQAEQRLAALMPAVIRVPGYVLSGRKKLQAQLRETRGRHADPGFLERRNAAIRAAYGSGEKTAAELMREYGLRKSQVYEILYDTSAA